MLAPGAWGGNDPTGREIMERVTTDHRARDERSEAEMIITGKGRTPRRRTLVLLTAFGEDGDDRVVLRFLKPSDISGTALLTIERGHGDEQYLYLPAFRKTRRIASSGKAERFAGTDFSYEDLRPEETDAHDYRVLRSEDQEGQACWVVEAVASSEESRDESAYARRHIWVRKDHHLPTRIDYFDDRDRLLKRLQHSGFRQVDGLWRASRAHMQDFLRESQTLMRYTAREINPGLSPRDFTKEALGRG